MNTLKTISRVFVALQLFWLLPAAAVVAVNPTGVNVRASGPTTVFLTFQALEPGEQPVEAIWCGAVQPGVVGGAVTADAAAPGTAAAAPPLAAKRAKAAAAAGGVVAYPPIVRTLAVFVCSIEYCACA